MTYMTPFKTLRLQASSIPIPAEPVGAQLLQVVVEELLPEEAVQERIPLEEGESRVVFP